jgi:cytochrome b561
MAPTGAVCRRLCVLSFLNLLQLLLYIPLIALLGQGVLFMLAGHQRQNNFFYQLLQLLSKPFTALVRKSTPAKVADGHVPIVTFFLLLIVYAVVTFEKISLCVRLGVEQCK